MDIQCIVCDTTDMVEIEYELFEYECAMDMNGVTVFDIADELQSTKQNCSANIKEERLISLQTQNFKHDLRIDPINLPHNPLIYHDLKGYICPSLRTVNLRAWA